MEGTRTMQKLDKRHAAFAKLRLPTNLPLLTMSFQKRAQAVQEFVLRGYGKSRLNWNELESNPKGNDATLAGLHALIRDLDLKVPLPAVKSFITGSRKTRITDIEVLELYPKSYQPPIQHG
jgi:hypothetical protein